MLNSYTGSLYKRPNKKGFTYYYKIQLGGETIKKKSCKTSIKKEAKKMLDTILYELNNGMSAALSKDMPLNDYLNCWLEDNVKLNCKYNTYETYKKLIQEHIKNTIGLYKIKQIDTYLIQQFINDMHKNGYSKSTIELTKNMLSGAFKCAIQTYNLININPIQYTKIPKYEASQKKIKDKIITVEQFNQLIELYPAGSDLYIPLQVAFYTGMRRGEVLGLQWKDIDLDKKIIYVKNTLIKKKGNSLQNSTKTESSTRDITIGDSLLKILKAHKTRQKENKLKHGKLYIDSDWLCTNELGYHLSINSFENKMVTLKKKINFDFTFHCLRHTHATLLIEAGANIKDVQKRLGHDNLATTMNIYSHVTENMKNQTVDIFERIVK